MLQIIGLLAISWALIRLFEKGGNLSVLGLLPTKSRMVFFVILFGVSAFFSALAFLMRMYYAKEVYVMCKPPLTATQALTELWYQFRTVMTEELLCRGVLLYFLIKKLAQLRAVVISSIVFGILHWMNAGVWGDLMQMATVFAFTFLMGLLLGFAYARSYSLLLPLAIHFGWNLVQNFVFPGSGTGTHVFVLAATPIITISYFAFFTMLLLPKVGVLIINYLIVRRYPKAGTAL